MQYDSFEKSEHPESVRSIFPGISLPILRIQQAPKSLLQCLSDHLPSPLWTSVRYKEREQENNPS